MITCMTVDDEPLALDLLEDNIGKIPFLKLVQKCSNAIAATEYLQQHAVDLIFLDIQMPGLNGIQFLQGLTKTSPAVIFVTAYEKYAVEGYNLDVVDYLLKPVSFERFLKAINKAADKFKPKTQLPATTVSDHLFVNADYNLVRIDLNNIAYIEGLKDYVKIYLLSSPRPIITRISMKSLEEKLPPDKFVRVHKSFIVSLSKIESIRKGRISLMKANIPISEHFKENLYRYIS